MTGKGFTSLENKSLSKKYGREFLRQDLNCIFFFIYFKIRQWNFILSLFHFELFFVNCLPKKCFQYLIDCIILSTY